jgi:YD repeat-containing protein
MMRYCKSLSFVYATLLTGSLQSATFTYFYDPLNRLTNAAYSDGSRESYSYDDAGNRLSRITLAPAVKTDALSPSIPLNVSSLKFVPGQLHLVWNRSFDTGGSGLSGYAIYVNDALATTTTGTNILLRGLAFDTRYCFSVAAYDRSTNVSAQSTPFCFTTAAFQPPFLSPLGFSNGHFRIGIVSGTPGLYDVLVSTNLFQWETGATLTLPLAGKLFVDPISSPLNERFYQLRWSTNAP